MRIGNYIYPTICLLVGLSLNGCGGDGSDDTSRISPQSLSTAQPLNSAENASGKLTIANNTQVVATNLSMQVAVSDPDGLDRVYLSFNQDSEQQFTLCANCGNTFTHTLTGLNPGEYGATPGQIDVNLWSEDLLGNIVLLSTISIDWQPPMIEDVSAIRNQSGDQVDITWQLNTNLLRYNLYIAAQSGVNKNNYTSLNEGQALLAVKSSGQQFTGLNPVQDYYLLVTGVDGSGESTVNTEIFIAGSQGNTLPIANDDDVSTDEDTDIIIEPLINDSDADNDILQIIAVETEFGSAIFDDTTITYTPIPDFNGTVQLTYTITDGREGTANAHIDVSVLPVNDPPDASDDDAQTQENSNVNIDVLANDSDIDGDQLSIISVNEGVGSTFIENDNTITYIPETDFVGVDDFSYTIEDTSGETATANVVVNVFSAGIPPIAINDKYEVAESTLLTVSAANGLLGNDASVSGGGLFVITDPVISPTSGQLTLASDGSFTYQPNDEFIGDDFFDYRIIDDIGNSSVARASVVVRAIPELLGGDSSSISGEFLYIGLGETVPANQIGSGRYRIGDCTQVGNTVCTFTGRYVERPDSGNQPSATGTYAFTQRWSGIGESPAVARSTVANSTVLTFVDLGDAVFELALFPDSGGAIRSIFPDTPFENSMGFGAFIQAQETCQGLPNDINCDIGQVGKFIGATLTSPLDRLAFTVPGGKYTLSGAVKPITNDDSYQTLQDQALIVPVENGVLSNDSNPNLHLLGDHLIETATISSVEITNFVGVGFDQYRQQLVTYSGFEDVLFVFDLEGNFIQTFDVPGVIANSFDIDFAPESFMLGNTLVPQGSALIFNGESGQVTVYAVDIQAGTIITSLTLSFGDSEVVGGAYNEVTNTLFLVQNSIAGFQPNTVAQVNPQSGELISTFSVDANGEFTISFGDIDVNSQTGHVYLVSSAEQRIAEFSTNGSFIRYVDFPDNPIVNASGMSVNHEGSQIWIATTTGELRRFEFANGGSLAQWHAAIEMMTENGELEFKPDGSFEYYPRPNFVGVDKFIYRVTDAAGLDSLSTVNIDVSIDLP
jgi:hypothetical protein